MNNIGLWVPLVTSMVVFVMLNGSIYSVHALSGVVGSIRILIFRLIALLRTLFVVTSECGIPGKLQGR